MMKSTHRDFENSFKRTENLLSYGGFG